MRRTTWYGCAQAEADSSTHRGGHGAQRPEGTAEPRPPAAPVSGSGGGAAPRDSGTARGRREGKGGTNGGGGSSRGSRPPAERVGLSVLALPVGAGAGRVTHFRFRLSVGVAVVLRAAACCLVPLRPVPCCASPAGTRPAPGTLTQGGREGGRAEGGPERWGRCVPPRGRGAAPGDCWAAAGCAPPGPVELRGGGAGGRCPEGSGGSSGRGGRRAARSRGGAARWLRPPAARWSWGLGRRAAWFLTAPILGLGGRGLLCFGWVTYLVGFCC